MESMTRKGFAVQKAEVNEKERSRVVRITTGAVDRDGEVVRPDGGDFKQFLLNPVVLFAHDYSSIPVGKCVSLTTDDKGVVAKTVYNNSQTANEIYQLAQDGFPLAVSIGFIPLEMTCRGDSDFQDELNDCVEKGWLTAKDAGSVRRIYSKWNLLEYSDVPVPANPEALQLMMSKGWTKQGGINRQDTKDAKEAEVVSVHLKIDEKTLASALLKMSQNCKLSLGAFGDLAVQNSNLNERSFMGKIKAGAVLSAENAAHLQKALEYHAEMEKCIKAVLANGGVDPNAPVPGDPKPDADGDNDAKGLTLDELKSLTSQVLAESTSKAAKAAMDELLTMVARSTGKHIEL